MKTIDSQELLEAYARDHSETAFEQLVANYTDLVYSTALRRTGGATVLAQDITQMVFTDLARKALSLPANVALGGWLHRHTGFVAASVMRREFRRLAREKQAFEMSTLNTPSDENWKQVAPLLDEAIDQLESTDRDAIILRFFEQRDLRSVGSAIGASEDTTQKRVSRALEKLRTLLVQRGVALSLAAFAALLSSRAVEAAPAGLAGTVGKSALAASTTASIGLAAAFLKLLLPTAPKLVWTAVLATLCVAALVVYRGPAGKAGLQPRSVAASSDVQDSNAVANTPLSGTERSQSVVARAPERDSSNSLRLLIVAKDSGQPVPSVQVDYRGWEADKFKGKKLFANRFGVCDVDVPRASMTRLELTTRSDSFADTRLHWEGSSGERIPATYTVRLVRAVTIGGRVIGPDDQPVAGAKLGFNHNDDPATTHAPEDHHFGWIEVSTDTEGRWTINRMAPEMIRIIYGSASHTDYVSSQMVFANRDPETERQLRGGSYTFQLGRPVTARGIVVDSDNQPVADANVLVGGQGFGGSRKGKSGPDGSFVVKGCRSGKTLVSAEAEGLAATTIETDLTDNSEPLRLVLQRGKTLLLRLADKNGQPVPKANVWLDTMNQRPINDPDLGKIAVQASFKGLSDADGRVVWSNAPDMELTFDIAARGYMRVNGLKVRPDGQEHAIALPPAVVVSGTVRDAANGEAIARFAVVCGWPETNFIDGTVSARWSSFGRDRLTFTDGEFKHSFEAPLLFGTANPGYMVRFEADGYAPLTSRPIRADESEVFLEIALHRAEDSTITVVQPDNRSAEHADVGLVFPHAGLQLMPGGLSHQNIQNGAALLVTDTEGKFRLPSDENVASVIVAHRSGFAEVSRAALAADPKVRLQPWGRIEGSYVVGGQPATNRNLIFAYGQKFSDAVGVSFESYQTKTDETGHFFFEQVPPGKHRIARLVQQGQAFTHMPVGDVDIPPGSTATVTLGGQGYAITARLGWPDDLSPGAGMHAVAHISTAPPQALAEATKQLSSDPSALARLQQSPEVQEYHRSARHFEATIGADYKSVSAEQLPPGDYILMINVMRPRAEGQTNVASIYAYTPFSIPADPASGTLDLGAISLRAAPAPLGSK